MRKLYFILCLAIAYSHPIHAQVNLQAGSAVFSLPVFGWQDDQSRLEGSIQLNYNSRNGLLVDEVATNVGQGWNLVAGGVITRLQVGQPDDQMPRDGAYSDITKYAPGYLYNPTAISAGCPTALANYPIFQGSNTIYKPDNITDADRELDYFTFQFNGRQGIFVLGKGNGDKGVALGDTKIKIWFDRDENMPYTRTSITAFHIQDEKGLTYTFRDKGLNKLTRVHYANIDQYGYATATGVPSFSANNIYQEEDFDELTLDEKPFIVNSWYLSEVDDALTGRKITFTYNTFNINTSSGQTLQLTKPYSYTTDRYITVSNKLTIAQRPAIASISYPDGHQVNFTYGAQRMDVIGDQVLQSIRVTWQNRTISQYDLKQSYFNRNSIGTPSNYTQGLLARLCLVSVQKTGVDGKLKEPPYTFDYNLGTDPTENCVPPLFTPIKDLWGYYNGDTDGVPTDGSLAGFAQYVLLFYHPLPGTLPNNDQSLKTKPKPGYAQLGLLKTITYPMGGTLSYTYAQNLAPTGSSVGQYFGGVHVATTTLHDGINSNNDIVTTYSYILADGSSSLWGVETPICRLLPTTYFRPESPYVKVGIPPCDYKYKYAGILSWDETVNPSDLQQFMTVFSQVLGYAGLAMDVFLLVSTSNPAFLIFDIVAGIADCVQDTRYLWYHTVDYNYNLLNANPLPAQYKRVEVTKGGSGANNGKTVYQFTSSDDYPLVVPDISNTFASKQRTAFWAYGLPKLVTAFDASGNTVSQTENDYDFSNAQTTIDPSTSASCKCYSIQRSSKGSDTWTSAGYINSFTTTNVTNMTSDPAIQDQLIVDPYTQFTGRVQLQTSYQRYYKDNTHFLQTQVSYEYSPNNYQLRKTTATLSNGDKSVKEIYYSSDYTASGPLQTLVSNNILDLPVATYTSIIKNNTSIAAYLNASVTAFTTLANGDIRSAGNYTGRTAQPGGTYSFDPANPLNYSGLTQTESFSYDADGNLIGLTGEGGRQLSKLYDYNGRDLVAAALNAGPGEIAYTSFESANNNGWTINQAAGTPVTSPTAVTGAKSLDLGSVTSLTATITPSKPYTLSFWSQNSVTVSGSTSLVRSAPQVNGFTYYEYLVAAGSAPPVISGSGHIDELRFYPANARMTTYTYDPLLGKTSECDAAGRMMFYEYDFLGRIRLVRDENRNIIKMYEYNFKMPQ